MIKLFSKSLRGVGWNPTIFERGNEMLSSVMLCAGFGMGVLAISFAKTKKEERLPVFGIWTGLLFLAALTMRLILAYTSDGFSVDIGTFKSWGEITARVGFGEIYQQDIFLDYPPGYLYVLALLEKIRQFFCFAIEGQTYTMVMKLPSILADLLCGGAVLYLARKKLGDLMGLFAAAAYLFCPGVFVNSAMWGQADSFCTMILLASVLLLYAERYVCSGLLYGVAVIFKPQMLVFAPLYLFFAIKRKRWLGLGLGVVCALAAILLVATPFTKNFDYAWLIAKYQSTLNYYDYYSINACNFWSLIKWNWRSLPHGLAGALLTVAAPIAATGACGALMFLSKRKDVLFAAPGILMGIMYIFGVKMHERYLFPAFLFVLLCFVFTRDRRQLWAFGLMAGANYLNVDYVLWLFREFGPTSYDPNAAASVAISALQTVALGYLLWVDYQIYIKEKIVAAGAPQKKESAKMGKKGKKGGKGKSSQAKRAPAPQSWLENRRPEPDLDKRMKLPDWIVMAAVTLIYALVAFWRLGGTVMPQTAWAPEQGESVVLEADVTCYELVYLPGLVPDANHYAARVGSSMRIESSQDGVYWEDCGETGNDYVFAWKTKALTVPGRFVRLTALDGSVALCEASIRPTGAEKVPAVTVQGEAGAQALVDEQDTVPAYKTYENSSYFDEIYHGRTAYEHILGLEPYESTHPPLGKHIISLGIRMFGMNPFGWRFMGTLFGVLMLPVLYHLCKQLFGRTWLCGMATFLFAFDFMHFTQTRIATIDTYAVFFLLLMYDAMVAFIRQDILKAKMSSLLIPLALSGIFMGLGVASKWTAAYGAVGLAVLFFGKLIETYRYESRGHRSTQPVLRRCGQLCGWCCLLFIAIPFGIYFAAYLPMTTLPHNVDHMFGSFINYQTSMFNYHSKLVATHDFASPWYEWPMDFRPIWYFSSDPCNAQGQYSTISAVGNPLLWWSCIPAALFAALLWFKQRRMACAVALTGFLAVYMPWVLVPRLTFIYHYFTAVPFLVVALAACVEWLTNQTRLGSQVVLGGKIQVQLAPLCMGAFSVLCLVLFMVYFPVISGKPTTHDYANALELMKSWFFSSP